MGSSTTRARNRASTSIMRGFRKFDKQYGVLPKAPQSVRASLVPVLLMSALFLVWGLIYGMLDIMNGHIASAMNLPSTQSSLMATSYYSAYLYVPVFVAGTMITYIGYRFTCVYGLFLIAVGAVTFAAAAKFRSAILLCVGQHFCGHGVSALETAANPYVTNAGPVKYRILRMLWCHSMCAFGTILAPMIADAVLYGASSEQIDAGSCILGVRHPTSAVIVPQSLDTTVALYYGIAASNVFLVFVYAAIFFGTNLVKEIPQSSPPKSTCGWRLWKHPIASKRYLRLWIGCVANFFNIAAQVTVAQFIIPHLEINACDTTKAATKQFRNAQILFLVGRLVPAFLVATGVLVWIRKSVFAICFRSRVVLWLWIAGAIGCSAAAGSITGTHLKWVAAFIMFFEAPSFPFIFEAATIRLGDYATLGESMMIVSISGGLVGPPWFGAIKEATSISKAWFLVVAFFVVVLSFSTLTNMVRSWRTIVDQSDLEEDKDQDIEILPTVLPPSNVDVTEMQAKGQIQVKTEEETKVQAKERERARSTGAK